jgi:hypothetical protein
MRDRSNSTLRTVQALLMAVVISVAGCGNDDNGSPTAPTPQVQSAIGVIANNHSEGHAAVVTAAQISAGRALTMDIRGRADHSHMLELTNDDVVRLQNRQRVDRDASMQNNHRHRVTFN